MSVANYLEDKVLNKVFNNTDFTVATPYLALHTADPTEAGTTGEVSTGGGSLYARQAASFGVSAAGVVLNDADIVFAEAATNWGTITHVSLWDASSGGNCLWVGALSASKDVGIGITFRIVTGQLSVSLD